MRVNLAIFNYIFGPWITRPSTFRKSRYAVSFYVFNFLVFPSWSLKVNDTDKVAINSWKIRDKKHSNTVAENIKIDHFLAGHLLWCDLCAFYCLFLLWFSIRRTGNNYYRQLCVTIFQSACLEAKQCFQLFWIEDKDAAGNLLKLFFRSFRPAEDVIDHTFSFLICALVIKRQANQICFHINSQFEFQVNI